MEGSQGYATAQEKLAAQVLELQHQILGQQKRQNETLLEILLELQRQRPAAPTPVNPARDNKVRK